MIRKLTGYFRGYIVPSSSQWGSPIICEARRKDSYLIDFKNVNAVTRPTPFYMPEIDEVIDSIGNSEVVSKLDMSKGFYQVMVKPEVQEKMAFICHAIWSEERAALFQSLMDKTLSEYHGFCKPYMDDVIIFSKSWDEHTKHS